MEFMILSNSKILVNLPSIRNYSVLLIWVIRFVVDCQLDWSLTLIIWDNCPWVTYVCYVTSLLYFIVDHYTYNDSTNSTWSWLFYRLPTICYFQIGFLRFLKTFLYGLLGILREVIISNYLYLIKMCYIIMKVIPQKLCTLWSAMSIIDCKKWALGPMKILRFIGWFHHVQNDGYSILVVVANKTLMGISPICRYHTNIFLWNLAWFYGWQLLNW